MKNYEFFNKQFGDNEPAEVQAFKSVMQEIFIDNGIDMQDIKEEYINKYINLFELKLEWLNEEKQ